MPLAKSTLPLRADLRTSDDADEILEAADKAARELQDDLEHVAEDLRVDSSKGIKTLFCIDFDVIRSSIDWFSHDSHESLWSSLCINFSKNDLVFLPGALFETLNYVKSRHKAARRISISPFREIFYEDVARFYNQDRVPESEYRNTLQSFERSAVSPKTLYMLRALQKRLLRAQQHQLPALDREVFEWCSETLSVGMRSDRWINNRVDAVNYSLVHRLNQDILGSSTRYVLVSNAPSMKKLDMALSNTIGLRGAAESLAKGVVRNARTAAMYQILLFESGSTSAAERIAFDLLLDISSYRAQLRRIKETSSQSNAGAGRAIAEAKSELNQLLGSFSRFDHHLREHKVVEDRNVRLFNLRYQQADPSEFYENLEKQVERAFEKSGYERAISDRNLDTSTLVVHNEGPKKPFGYLTQYVATDSINEKVAFARCYEDHITFFSLSNAPVNEFARTVSLVTSNVLAKRTKGTYRGFGDEREGAVVLLGSEGSGVTKVDLDDDLHFRFTELCEKVKILPSSVTFLRYDGPYFTASFELDMCVIKSKYRLEEEFGLFLDELVQHRFKGRGIQEVVASICRSNKSNLIDVLSETEAA